MALQMNRGLTEQPPFLAVLDDKSAVQVFSCTTLSENDT